MIVSRAEILCVDISGCRAAISLSELHRFLDAKILGALEDLRTQKEILTVQSVTTLLTSIL
jgi:hypothetical protein